jgi:hypothetical protein
MFRPFHTNIAFKCFYGAHVSCCSKSEGAQVVMVARHGHWVMMGRGELGADGRDARHADVLRTGRAEGRRSRVGCVLGTGQTASNRGGQGELRVQGESCGRVGAMIGWVRVWGGNKISAQGQAVRASGRILARDIQALIAPFLLALANLKPKRIYNRAVQVFYDVESHALYEIA